jgi:streptogramin lyase
METLARIVRPLLRAAAIVATSCASLAGIALLGCADAAAQVATEYTVTGAARRVTAGPDGNIWFVQDAPDAIIRVTPAGVMTFFTTGLTLPALPESITVGPDGNLWFTEQAGNRIGRITTSGVITEFSTGITANSEPSVITAGPDGNLWFTERLGPRIARITTAGVVTEFGTGITPGSEPYSITAGPDGNLWFTEFNLQHIGRITTAGVVTEFGAGITPGTRLVDIVTGLDGNLWFTEVDAAKIGRITPAGVVTEFPTGIPTSPFGITVGPDGNFWFGNEGGVTGIGRMTPTGVVTLFSAGFTGTVYFAVTGPDGNIWFSEPCCAHVGKIAPAPPLPTLSINNVSQNEGNSGLTPFVFTVTLSAPSASTVTVAYATADGTATAGSDYNATSGTLTFNPGVTTQTITVNVIGDTIVEPDETFTVNLSSPVGATIAVGTGTGTIVNDDVAAGPTLSINNVSANEGNSGTTPFVFTVTLSAASGSTVTVNYATADGTATAGSDYAAASGVLTFAPGATTQTITVNVIGDTTPEPNETFFVNLSGATNATIAVSQGIGTIVNDDAAPPATNVVIPTLSEWGLVLLALLLGALAMVTLRRRR